MTLCFYAEEVIHGLGLPLLFRVDIDARRLGGGSMRSYSSWPFQSAAFYRRLLERWRETSGRADLAESVLWITGFAETQEYRPWSIGLADQFHRAGVRPYLLGDTISAFSTARFPSLALPRSVAARADGMLPENACCQATDLEGVRLVISGNGHVASNDDAEDNPWSLLLSAPVPGTDEEVTRRFHNVDAVVLAVAFREHSVEEIEDLVRTVRSAGLPILGVIGIGPQGEQSAASPSVGRSGVAHSSATQPPGEKAAQPSVEKTNGVARHAVLHLPLGNAGDTAAPVEPSTLPGAAELEVLAAPRPVLHPAKGRATRAAEKAAKRDAHRATREAARQATEEAARREAERATQEAARQAAIEAQRLETERSGREAARLAAIEAERLEAERTTQEAARQAAAKAAVETARIEAERVAQETARQVAAKAAAEAAARAASEAVRLDAERAAEETARQAADAAVAETARVEADRVAKAAKEETRLAVDEAARQTTQVSRKAPFSIGTVWKEPAHLGKTATPISDQLSADWALDDGNGRALPARPDDSTVSDAPAPKGIVLGTRMSPKKPRRRRTMVLAVLAVALTGGCLWIGQRLPIVRGDSTTPVAQVTEPPQSRLQTNEGEAAKPPESIVKPAAVDIADEANSYVVQVSSFRIRTEAEAELARLSRSGIPARVVPADVPKRGRWYRIVTGSFRTLDAANAAALSLQQTPGINEALVCTKGGKGTTIPTKTNEGGRAR